MSIVVRAAPIYLTKQVIDINNEPDPIKLTLELEIINNAEQDVYIKVTSTKYTVENPEQGSVTAGGSRRIHPTIDIPQPASLPYSDTIDVVIEVYADSNYTQKLTEGTLEIPLEIDNYEAWASTTIYTFDEGDEGWTGYDSLDSKSVEPGGQSLKVHADTSSSQTVTKAFTITSPEITPTGSRMVVVVYTKVAASSKADNSIFRASLRVKVYDTVNATERVLNEVWLFYSKTLNLNESEETPWRKLMVEVPSDMLSNPIQIIIEGELYLYAPSPVVNSIDLYIDHVVIAQQ